MGSIQVLLDWEVGIEELLGRISQPRGGYGRT